MSNQVFISVDVETSGPIPNPFSMLSLGAVAFSDATGTKPGRAWYEKLTPAFGDEHVFGKETKEWWETQKPAALKEALDNPTHWRVAMLDFQSWVNDAAYPAKPILLAAPTGYDGLFVNTYAIRANQSEAETEWTSDYGGVPWKHRILDFRSYASAVLNITYHEAGPLDVAKLIGFEAMPLNHWAIDDARMQGQIFMALRGWLKARG